MTRRTYVGTYPEGAGADQAGARIFLIGDAAADPARSFDLGAPYLDASYLAVHPGGRILYSVDRTQGSGGVAAWAIDPGDGSLRALDVFDSGGVEPCHLSLDADATVLFVANYGGGTVSSYRLAADGRIAGPAEVVAHRGSGPDPQRQREPHPHMAIVDPRTGYLLVPDLGCDQIFVYAVDHRTGGLTPRADLAVTLPPGAGPRHVAFFPDDAAVVANELDSTAALLVRDGEAFTVADVVKTAPEGIVNFPSAVHTSPDGSLAYVANRGHDSVASLQRDRGGQSLRLVATSPCGGRPRDMVVDAETSRLLVANQHHGSVVSLPLGEGGIPGQIDQRWDVPNASCPLVWHSPSGD